MTLLYLSQGVSTVFETDPMALAISLNGNMIVCHYANIAVESLPSPKPTWPILAT